jgi:putative ABC transport system permease protein
MTSGDRVFRTLLRLYPAEFRTRFGGEMLELFQFRRQAARSRVARLRLWASVFYDTLRSVVRERSQRRRGIVEPLREDIRHAGRLVRRTPGFSTFVIILMALGIGSTTAVFSVVHAVLLRPLPFKDPERLMFVWEQRYAVRRNVVGGHEFPVWKERSRSFESMAAIAFDRDYSLTGAGDPVALNGARVTSDFFRVLGVPPVAGAVFGPEADRPGQGEVAVISHRLWKERFGADPALIGRTIALNDRPHVVAAVMPAGFEFPSNRLGLPPDLWTPIAEPIQQYRGRHYLFVIGRLGSGVTQTQAQTELASIAEAIEREFPPNKQHGANVQPMQAELVDSVRSAILILFAAVGVVLLVGCCNIANLLLARATARQHEVAIRAALGASRWRIARQLLAEGGLLSIAGAGVGLLLATWLVSFARSTVPGHVPRLETASIDPATIAFTLGVAVATTLIFALVPLWQLSRVQVADRLRSSNKGVPAPSRHPLRNALIVAEVALTVALSIGAALLVQSIVHLQRVDPGFDPVNITTVGLTLPESRYAGPVRKRSFYVDVLERVAALDGVEMAAATNMVPQGEGLSGIAIAVEGRPPARPGEEVAARYRVVSTDYFRTLGIATVRGRTFHEADARAAVPLIRWFQQQRLPERFAESQAAPVAVINETMAREIWPGEDAIGRSFRVLFSPPVTIVGIVADARNAALSDEPVAEFYLSDLQEPQSRMTLLVRSAAGASVLPAIRAQVASIDPKLPITAVRSLEEVVDTNLALHRFISTVIGGFAAAALVLMIAGVYCVISYATAQRTHEIGIRLALGATRIDIGGLVARGGIALCLAGAALGAAGGYGLGRFASTLLYEIEPADPSTYAVLIGLVLVIAAVASWIPAARAMRVDPVMVLRNE